MGTGKDSVDFCSNIPDYQTVDKVNTSEYETDSTSGHHSQVGLLGLENEVHSNSQPLLKEVKPILGK